MSADQSGVEGSEDELPLRARSGPGAVKRGGLLGDEGTACPREAAYPEWYPSRIGRAAAVVYSTRYVTWGGHGVADSRAVVRGLRLSVGATSWRISKASRACRSPTLTTTAASLPLRVALAFVGPRCSRE